jgi:tRNA-splicing ligase RtcB (3'-phosphate/5'-hydroxy nucleic acid ligase)
MSDAGRIAGHGLRQVDEALCEIPAQACVDMRVPARVFADRELLEQIAGDRSLEQLQNVATLPGIVDAALAMPDIRQGYGFPVGGVAATDPPDGVVSPGGVGYDINCGVRLLALPMSAPELGARREPLVHEIARRVPVGAGHGGALRLSGAALDRVLVQGPSILVAEHGFGVHRTSSAPSRGPPGGSRPRGGVRASVGARGQPARHARVPGRHFIELQCVARVLDPVAADAFGLRLDQLTC